MSSRNCPAPFTELTYPDVPVVIGSCPQGTPHYLPIGNAVLGITWAMGWKVWAEVSVWVNDRFGADRGRSGAVNSGKGTSAFAYKRS
jgi:hypothetical protein